LLKVLSEPSRAEPKALSRAEYIRPPEFVVTEDGRGIVSHAGAMLLTETAWVTGLPCGLPQALGRWWLPRSVHDPA
jgi:hypothetical protein